MGRLMFMLLLFVVSVALTTATEVIEDVESNRVAEEIETVDLEEMDVKSSDEVQAVQPMAEPAETLIAAEESLSDVDYDVKELSEPKLDKVGVDEEAVEVRSSSTGSAGEEDTDYKPASPSDTEEGENEEQDYPEVKSVVVERKGNCSDAAEGKSVVDPKRAHYPNPKSICPSDIQCLEGELCIMHANYPSCYHPQRACHYLPCQHGGTCQANNQCRCISGFTGSFCELSTQSCNLICYNQGTCTLDNRGHASCQCSVGFSGTNCQTPASNPVCNLACYNRGTCVVNAFGLQSCLCAYGFSGANCLTPDAPACSMICYNQGTCTFDVNGYQSCTCAPGFSGRQCQKPNNNPVCNLICYNQGTCVLDAFGLSSCNCPIGFSGTNCQTPEPVCNLICYNQGSCVLDSYGTASCACQNGFSGTNCQTPDNNPVCNLVCYHQGTCVLDAFGLSSCLCQSGFSGTHCQTPDNNPVCNLVCYNQGTCVLDAFGLSSCNCAYGFGGTNCQTQEPVCNLVCYNQGTCTLDSYGASRCTCSAGFTGPQCATTLCNLNCYNQGSCTLDLYGQPLCVCQSGYTGTYCQIPPNVCSLNCLNGGTCYTDIYGQQSCQCIPPWGGLLCDRPADNPLCDAVNCEGDCVCQESCRHEDGYVCVSDLGYLGRLCNIPIPDLECTSNEIIVSVSQLFYAEWDMNKRNSIIYMSPTVDGIGSNLQQCQAQLVGSNYRIAISHPFTQCGTQTTTEVGSDGYNRVSFTNALWINKNFGSAATSYDMPFGIIRFKCVYGNSYTIYTSIRPLIDEPPVITEEQDYQISASLCKISTCNAVCPASLAMQQSAIYTVGQIIHLDFGITNINNPVVFNNLPVGADTIIDYVFLSCSSSTPLGSTGLAPQEAQIALFQEGCPTDHGLALQAVMGSSTLDNRACISFRLPRSKVCSEIYIHARLHVCIGVLQQATCPNGAIAPRCTQARRKRSASSAHDGSTNPITIGPIYVLEKEEGDSHVTFLVDGAEFNMKTSNRRNMTGHEMKKPPQNPKVLIPKLPDTMGQNTGIELVLLIVGVSVSLVVLGLAFVLFVHRRRTAKPESLGL